MSIKENFFLNKFRCEVAMQQVLQSWHPTPRIGIECPECNSNLICKNGVIKGVQGYLCKNCQQVFLEKPNLVCDCSIPGKQLKCQECPQFKEFLEIVKQKVNKLLPLDILELQKIKSEIVIPDDEGSDTVENSHYQQE